MNTYVLLLGTRHGHILECTLANEYQGLKAIEGDKVSSVKEKLSLETRIVVRSGNFLDDSIDF